jgi:hypothetical protein
MKLPSSLCGTAKDVSSGRRKHITRFLRGAPWIEAEAEMIEAEAAPGLIILNGPVALLGSEPHVHAYAPVWELGRALDAERLTLEQATPAFDAALSQPWSLLGLLSQANYRWLEDLERAERFLAALTSCWSTLDAVGPRYTMGSRTGQRLWDLPHLLKYVLANRGVQVPALTAPLPPGGLAELTTSR